MQPIYFDQQFQEYAGRFVQRNRTKFRNPEQIETMMPDLFAKWCRTPKKWLEGKSPEQYFQGFTEPAALVELMRAYLAYDLTPPSLLLDRLVDLPGAEGAVLPLVEDGDPHMAILAIQLLIELDSRCLLYTSTTHLRHSFPLPQCMKGYAPLSMTGAARALKRCHRSDATHKLGPWVGPAQPRPSRCIEALHRFLDDSPAGIPQPAQKQARAGPSSSAAIPFSLRPRAARPRDRY